VATGRLRSSVNDVGMTDAIDLTTEQRNQLTDLLRRFLPGVAVWAYGSRVKWTARPNSDLDIVAFTVPEQRAQVADLKDALAESNLPFPVDLHVWDDVPDQFREIIRKEYVVVQEAKPSESKASKLSEWREVSVDEIKAPSENALATGPFGSSIGSRFFKATGIPVIRGSNLSEDIGTRLNDEGLVFLTPDKAQEFSRSTVREGDLVFTCWGTVNQIGLIDGRATYREYVISNKQMKLTPDPAKADSLFLYYLFSSPDLQDRIKNEAIGSSVPGFNLGQLRAMRLVIPEPDEQSAIAHILGTLDNKIELNRRMNETLEAMARALFKSWFVDFDPVRAKAAGRDTGLPKHLADLFPDSFEDSELGEIPKGWKVKTAGDLAEVVGGSTPSTTKPAFWDGMHHWATPKDLSNLSVPVLLNTERRVTDAGLAQISSGLLSVGTVLLSSRAPIGYLAIAEVPVAINQGFIAMNPRAGVSNLFLMLWARSAHDEIVSRANGSTFLEISKANFRPIPLIAPPTDVMRKFDQTARPLYERIVECARETRSLATLRDTLLPKLISGELRVRSPNKLRMEATA
jgi:type I restriction enzyme S subunit